MPRLGSCQKLTRYVTAPALMLWMAGVGCIFGCESARAAIINHSPGRSTHSSQPPESCAAHVAQSCCESKARHPRSELTEITENHLPALTEVPRPHSIMRCPMGINQNAVVTTVRVPEAVVGPVQPLSQSSEVDKQLIQLSSRLPVLNRGGTHLRCCVFLI